MAMARPSIHPFVRPSTDPWIHPSPGHDPDEDLGIWGVEHVLSVMQYGTPYMHYHVYALAVALWGYVRTYVLTTTSILSSTGSRTP